MHKSLSILSIETRGSSLEERSLSIVSVKDLIFLNKRIKGLLSSRENGVSFLSTVLVWAWLRLGFGFGAVALPKP